MRKTKPPLAHRSQAGAMSRVAARQIDWPIRDRASGPCAWSEDHVTKSYTEGRPRDKRFHDSLDDRRGSAARGDAAAQNEPTARATERIVRRGSGLWRRDTSMQNEPTAPSDHLSHSQMNPALPDELIQAPVGPI